MGEVVRKEEPHHYHYLKLYRVEQCKEFQDKRCPNHKPYTCFNWHFPNQRRRKPTKLRDGSFNYTPDIYCTQYDETKGACPSGESCKLSHRNLGDTEKRYHLRYYKTEPCVHGVDSKGHCTRNGQHCAFAHGPEDQRAPVYDNCSTAPLLPGALQLQMKQQGLKGQGDVSSYGGGSQMMTQKDEFCLDPQWNDKDYLLKHFKVEQCPRILEQQQLFPQQVAARYQCKLSAVGICPFWHSEADRRRDMQQCKYNSLRCPQILESDRTWLSSECDRGDECSYCHTLIELQYHPNIYQTVECNKYAEGKCRKGMFCPFSHFDTEATSSYNAVQAPAAVSFPLPTEPGKGASVAEAVEGGVKKVEVNDAWWKKKEESVTGKGSIGALDDFSGLVDSESKDRGPAGGLGGMDWLDFTSLPMDRLGISAFNNQNEDMNSPDGVDANNAILLSKFKTNVSAAALEPPLYRLGSIIDDDDVDDEIDNDDEIEDNKVNSYGVIMKPKLSSSSSSRSSSRAVGAAAGPAVTSASDLRTAISSAANAMYYNGLSNQLKLSVEESNSFGTSTSGKAETFNWIEHLTELQRDKQIMIQLVSDHTNTIEKLREELKESQQQLKSAAAVNSNGIQSASSKLQQWNGDMGLLYDMNVYAIPMGLLQNKESALRRQLSQLQQVIYGRRRAEGIGGDCMNCGARDSVDIGRGSLTSSSSELRRRHCYHSVLCTQCSPLVVECPICHMPIYERPLP